MVIIIIWAVICAIGAGYYGGQLGYAVYGWIGAVVGAGIGATLGGIIGCVTGFALLAWGEHSDEEESWGEAWLKILGVVLGLLLIGGVYWGINNVPPTIQISGKFLGLGIIVLVFLVFFGYIIWGYLSKSFFSPSGESTEENPHQDDL